MISEVAYFDVSREDRDNDRRVAAALLAVPAGSRVIMFLGKRKHSPVELLGYVAREYILDFAFEFQGEPFATQAARKCIQYLHSDSAH